MVDQAGRNAQTLLSLIEGQVINENFRQIEAGHGLFINRNDKTVLSLGADIQKYIDFSQRRSFDKVIKIGSDNWVVASRCQGIDCVIFVIRDTDRRFAVRWLLVSIFLPLLGIFLVALLGLSGAIGYGLKPLRVLADDVMQLDLDRLEKLPIRKRSKELLPLVDAIIVLTHKMSDQLERERAFLDACAHEIRTPVTGLISQLQSLDFEASPKMCKQMSADLIRIEESAKRTAHVANQFLNLARTGNILTDKKALSHFDVVEVVRRTLARIISLKPESDIELMVSKPVFVKGDPFAIELIVENLVENSLRHAHKNSKQESAKKPEALKIFVTCLMNADEAVLSVEDNGYGVPHSVMPHLVERFYQYSPIHNEHKSENTSLEIREGTGLGLNIVKQVVAVWGGQLVFEKSKTMGGLAVKVFLPK